MTPPFDIPRISQNPEADHGDATILRNELERIRNLIVNDIAHILPARKKSAERGTHPRDLAALEVLKASPKISARGFCRAMNARQDKHPETLGPPPGWGIQVWTEALLPEHRNTLYQYLHRKRQILMSDALKCK